MKRSMLTVGIAASAALIASSALAAQCQGIGSRFSAQPVVIQEGDDGAKTMLVGSTGTSTIIKPAEKTGSASWQHCGGIYRIAADNSGSGSGHCYTVDPDGDQWVASWQGKNGRGTWAYLSGTGKYANIDGGGTWQSGAKYADGRGLTHWEGPCPH